ncbi:MAG: hypothetical protein D3915_11460 [Candidatus Electrothrix sp. AU1_5]|nr:hypothetical protein [Candidatus Electrothrix gigas]
MKKQILSLAAGAALVFAAQSSFAGSVVATGGPLAYDVELTAGCTASVVGGGNLSTQSSPYAPVIDAPAGVVTVNCTNTTAYGVCVDAGLNDDTTTRLLLSDDGVSTLAYRLDTDNAAVGTPVGDVGCAALEVSAGDPSTYTDTTTWGDAMVSGTGDATDQTVNLYADVVISTDSVPGTYTDTVTVTVVYP